MHLEIQILPKEKPNKKKKKSHAIKLNLYV